MAKNSVQRLFEAGVQFSEMSRQQAEEAVRRLVKAGEVRRSETEATVQALIEQGRQTAIAIAEAVQQEVARQLGWLATRVDDVEDQMEALVTRLMPGSATSPTTPETTPPAGSEPATPVAAKKSPARKTTAKTTTPRKSASKATARKASAKRAPSRSGAAKSTTARKAGGVRGSAAKAPSAG